MKIKTIVLICLIGVVVMSVSHREIMAKSKTDNPVLKIGVVTVFKVFQGCKRNETYKRQAQAEEDRIIAELKKLKKELEADQAGLVTLKAGSADRENLTREILMKQANLQAQQKFYEQQLSMKDQRWTEKFYKDILQMIEQVAEKKGLALVLENDEPQLPAENAQELWVTIRMNKLLYSGGCVDITEEVIAQLDAVK